MKKVAVIMSTYNGERYLKEQLESLYQQENVELTLFVRDDGSKDNTVDLINSFAEKMNIVVKKANNVGFERSFMEATLLTAAHVEDFDYFAFCDQDDIWDVDKLNKGIQYILLNANEQATLYCSNQRIVDENGKFVRNEPTKQNTITKESSLLSLNQRGCVMVWNKQLHRHLIKSYQKLDEKKLKAIPAHDTWITILTYTVGKVYLDSTITMSYRVSTHNVAGSYVSRIGRIKYIYKKTIKTLKDNRYKKQEQALLLYDYIKSQSSIDGEYIQSFLESQKTVFSRLAFLMRHKYFSGMSKKWILLSSLLIVCGVI